MGYDKDDPPPPSSSYNQYWYVFKVTLPTNMVWLLIYILAFSFVVPWMRAMGNELEALALDGWRFECATARAAERFGARMLDGDKLYRASQEEHCIPKEMGKGDLTYFFSTEKGIVWVFRTENGWTAKPVTRSYHEE